MWVKNLTTSFTVNVHVGDHLKVRRDVFVEVRFVAIALLCRGIDRGTFPADSYLDRFEGVVAANCNDAVYPVAAGRKLALEPIAEAIFGYALKYVQSAPLVAIQSVRVGLDEHFRNSFTYLPAVAGLEIVGGRLVPSRQSYRDEVTA